MPYYRITVVLKTSQTRSGVRHFAEDHYYKIEKEVWEKASMRLGRLSIERILLQKVPDDHPDVLALIHAGKR